MTATMALPDRITAEPDKMGGRPCIRGMRIRVTDVLQMLAGGASEAEILRDFPYLEAEDIRAALAYAAEEVDHPILLLPAAE
jgi:uncharacterized protein (DUF433 family)